MENHKDASKGIKVLPTTASSIHINPKFRNAHFNPNFINKNAQLQSQQAPQSTNIYINPKFLTDPSVVMPHFQMASVPPVAISFPRLPSPPVQIPPKNKIISKTSHKLIRQPIQTPPRQVMKDTGFAERIPLIKIGVRKLIRAGDSTSKSLTKRNTVIAVKLARKPPKKLIRKPLQTKYKIVKEQTTYKIDRRTIKAKLVSPVKRVGVAGTKFGLLRPGINESLTPTKVIITNHKLLRM